MSRYIDADHAEFRLQCCGTYHGVIAFDTVKAVLNDAPSIDIVRCKECKHWHKWSDWEMFCGHFDGGIGSDADDYCSYGEREVE